MSYLPLPTAVETQTTRALITARHEEIRAVELEIQEFEREIQSRAEKIALIRDDIAQKESFIAPVRRLPFDVLAEIVVASASDHATSVHALRTLSSLCRTWRDATLRTPRAWTKITFIHPFLGSVEPDVARSALSTLRDVRLWLLRSGTCPADAIFELFRMRDAAKENEIFDIVYANASRLRSLTISTEVPRADVALVKKALAQPMPLLEHLGVDSYVGRLDAASRGTILWTHLPRLSSVALHFDLDHLPDAVRGQLRDLRIVQADPSILNELRTEGRYSLLQSLRITSLPTLGALPSRPVELAGLRVLYLDLDTIRAGPSFMRSITVPKLERLALRLSHTHIIDMTKKEAASMLDSVFKLSPPLRELRLQGISLSDVELHKALCHLPLLEGLVMLDVKTSDKLSDALSEPRRRGGWICPRLTHLCIGNAVATYGHKYSVSRVGMEKLVQARSLAGDVATLRHVRLDTSELYGVGTAWAWDSEERGEDDYSSDSDSSSTPSEGRNRDNLFETTPSPTVPLWWQVDVSPYFNFDPDN
ncbi:hypothetical protein EXIGLDRAFT_829454 [Exidia glandulosa HHB12029]|uniref:F-box domain-containing protein n=1 Tax=Exidia glandulosa HHB12029 TaxID=1314781 RepID=A0A165PJ90_EXIGL|nr:hypothetical protein EXIGLDRAFT_829454 [Exidia glandulosa HHB12029]